jgi:tetraacyldisaccharide 4'-kinase
VDRPKLERWWRQAVAGGGSGAIDQASRAMLFAASLPFEVGARMRGVFFATGMLPTIKVPVPVISFGNLTVGGTGKTPAVIWCANYLADKGLTPGIASRGYSPDESKVEAPNDEAALIKEALPGVPHVWNANRVAAARVLLADHHVNVIILDDGFQHRRIHRTIDFLLLDALNPFGYGYMLPRGYLREPKSALKRATAVIITRANLVSRDELQKIIREIRVIDANAKIAEAIHRPTGLHFGDGTVEAPESLKGKKVIAFCGIGNPSAFVTTLTHLGAKVVGVRAYDDHHAYCQDDFDCIMRDAAAHEAEKDRVKTGWRDGAPVRVAELRVVFELIRGKEMVESTLNFLVNGMRERAR